MWRAGDSSASFSAQRHGCFNFVCEAPFWDDARLRDGSLSAFSLADVVRRHRARLERLSTIALPIFATLPLDPSPDAINLHASLAEVARLTPIQIAFADRLIAGTASPAPLPVNDFAIHDTVLALTALRAWAMLARLARLLSARQPAVMAQAVRSAAQRDAGLRELDRECRLRPVPAAEASALQVDAVFAVTRALARTG